MKKNMSDEKINGINRDNLTHEGKTCFICNKEFQNEEEQIQYIKTSGFCHVDCALNGIFVNEHKPYKWRDIIGFIAVYLVYGFFILAFFCLVFTELTRTSIMSVEIAFIHGIIFTFLFFFVILLIAFKPWKRDPLLEQIQDLLNDADSIDHFRIQEELEDLLEKFEAKDEEDED